MANDIIDPFEGGGQGGGGINDPFASGQSSWADTAVDVAKQIPAGIAAGVEALPGAPAALLGMVGHGVEAGIRSLGLESPEAAEQIRQREALKQQIQAGLPTLEKAGIIPEPRTTAGQYARTASEFIPAALSGPGGVTRRIATGAVAPGLASEAAGQATAGTAAEPYARAAASFMPFGRVRPGEINPSFDAEKLFDSGGQRYEQVAALDTQWKPQAIARLGDRIDAALSQSYDRVGNNRVYGISDMLRSLRDVEDPEGGKAFVTANDIDSARQQFRNVAYSDYSQSSAAWKAVHILDDYMATTPQRDLLQGNAQQVSKLLGAARDDWAAAYRTQVAQGKIMLGEFNAATANSGMNVDNSIRQAVKQLVRPNSVGEIPAKKLGYTDDEITQLNQIAKGTNTRNFIRYLGHSFPGSGGGFLVGADMAGSVGAALGTGDPRYLWGLAALPAGFALRKAANRITEQEAASVAGAISRRSALGRESQSTMIPSQAVPLGTAAALRAGTAAQVPFVTDASGNQYNPTPRKAGGRVEDEKATKFQANYRGGHGKTACRYCTMFRAPRSCTAVKGSISPYALCNYFKPKG